MSRVIKYKKIVLRKRRNITFNRIVQSFAFEGLGLLSRKHGCMNIARLMNGKSWRVNSLYRY